MNKDYRDRPEQGNYNSRKDDQDFRKDCLRSVCKYLGLGFCATIGKKIAAVILLLAGVPVKEISDLLDLDGSTVYNYRNEIFSVSTPVEIIAFLVIKRGSGRKNSLASIKDEILKGIDSHNFFTLTEIAEWIQETFAVKICLKTVSAFLVDNGIRKLKGGSFPLRADAEKQAQCFDDILKPLIELAKKRKIILLFMDGSHFVLGNDFLPCVYGSKRRFLRTYSGRKRYNVLGAIDHVTHKVHTVTTESGGKGGKNLSADTVMQMLVDIRTFYGSDKRICIVMDNAAYQTCNRVKDEMTLLEIEYIPIPPYSPNLNFIERLWRFVKKELRKTAWSDFKAFVKCIDDLIASTTGSNKDAISSLINSNVQLFSDYRKLDDYTFEEPSRRKKAG